MQFEWTPAWSRIRPDWSAASRDGRRERGRGRLRLAGSRRTRAPASAPGRARRRSGRSGPSARRTGRGCARRWRLPRSSRPPSSSSMTARPATQPERRSHERAADRAVGRGVDDLGPPENARHRHAGGDRLGHHDQVGLDPEVLDREELAGAAEPGLHLVGDEHDPVLRRQLAQRRAPTRRGGTTKPPSPWTGSKTIAATFSGGDMRRQHPPQGVERLAGRVGAGPAVRVRERRPVDLGGERAHPGLVRVLLRGERHRHQRAAMEGAVERDHRLAAGRVAGDLDGVLDGLGAGVEERRLLGARDRRRARAAARPARRRTRTAGS